MLRFGHRPFLVVLSTSLLLSAGCAVRSKKLTYAVNPGVQTLTYPLVGDTQPVHDPSMIRQSNVSYVFTSDPPHHGRETFLPIRCSQDRLTWAVCGRVFARIPDWVRAKVPGVHELWAPDISFFQGLYHVYYAGSTPGSQRSVIGLATNTTLDPADPAYKWVDRGEVLESRPGMDFNAIDPNILVDADGSVWMTFGSFWSGIKQIQIDPGTGGVLAASRRYNLAERPGLAPDAIEGASVVHHGAYYYLFVSFDNCCNADVATDDYKEAVGRGQTPHGPFKDASGKPMLRGGGTVILEGNGTWNAPGGGTAYIDPASGEAMLVFHALDMKQRGATHLWLKRIDWQNDWPVLVP